MEPKGRSLLTPGIAQEAVSIGEPAIIELMKSGKTKRKAMSIEVYNPDDPSAPLCIHRIILDEKDWQDRFADLAHGKCEVADREGMDTMKIADRCPRRFREGDVKYPGAVNRDGTIVGCSGDRATIDHMCAEMIANIANGLIRDMMVHEIADAEGDRIVLPEAA